MKRWLFAGLFCALASVARLTVFGQAPAQPILLVVNTAANAANPYGPYLAEILRAEGVNSFDVVDLASMTEWPVAGETRSVDDQVEWLDNDHVVYGMVAGPGLPELSLGLWLSDIRQNAGQNQRLYAHAATSPSVVRQP